MNTHLAQETRAPAMIKFEEVSMQQVHPTFKTIKRKVINKDIAICMQQLHLHTAHASKASWSNDSATCKQL